MYVCMYVCTYYQAESVALGFLPSPVVKVKLFKKKVRLIWLIFVQKGEGFIHVYVYLSLCACMLLNVSVLVYMLLLARIWTYICLYITLSTYVHVFPLYVKKWRWGRRQRAGGVKSRRGGVRKWVVAIGMFSFSLKSI